MGKGYSEQSLQAGCNASYLYSDRNTQNVSKNLGHLKAENSLSRQRWPMFSYRGLRITGSLLRDCAGLRLGISRVDTPIRTLLISVRLVLVNDPQLTLVCFFRETRKCRYSRYTLQPSCLLALSEAFRSVVASCTFFFGQPAAEVVAPQRTKVDDRITFD